MQVPMWTQELKQVTLFIVTSSHAGSALSSYGTWVGSSPRHALCVVVLAQMCICDLTEMCFFFSFFFFLH